MLGNILEIKRFAVHDGPGIRTTVFLKGCPLKCVWCHNPESIGAIKQFGFLVHKCVNCGRCVAVCSEKAHSLRDGVHAFSRDNCVLCGKCTEICPSDALVIYGYTDDADSVLSAVLADKAFYLTSGGGVTLSGGECLMQADFCADLLKKLKAEGVHTAIDTCGFVPRASIDKVIDYTDLFLYDIKAYDEEVHIKCTGQSNKAIMENLKYLNGRGKQIEVRIPYVPGFNSGEIERIGKLLSELKNVIRVKILPYHNYAGSKYISLDMKNTMPLSVPSDKEIKEAEELIAEYFPLCEK